jgi:hypothetical protein
MAQAAFGNALIAGAFFYSIAAAERFLAAPRTLQEQ